MLKRIFLILLISIAVIFTGGFIISYFYGEKVKSYVIAEINKKLDTPVDVSNIRFSVFRNFPNASLVFHDVFIRDQTEEKPDTLLYAKKISFLIGLSQLFEDDLAVKRIVIESGVLKVSNDKTGAGNYEIWKKDSIAAEGSANVFRLEEVLVKSTRVKYRNDFKKLAFMATVKEGSMKGAFSSELFELESTASIDIGYFHSEGLRFAKHKAAAFALDMKIDSKAKIYTINSGKLKLDDLDFVVEGNINNAGKGLMLNLHVSSPGSGPQALLSLFPGSRTGKANDFTYKGTVSFDMTIRGILDQKQSPLIDIDFGARQVSIIPKKNGVQLKQVNFTGSYTNLKSKSQPASFLSVQKFQAVMGGHDFRGSIEITDFKAPFVKMQVSGTLDLAQLSEFYMPDTVESMKGMIVTDAAFSGKIGQLKTYLASGSLELRSLDFRLKKKSTQFRDFNGIFTLAGNKVEMENFSGNIGASDFLMQGSFTNLFSYLLLPDERLSVNASLSSRELNLDELIEKKETRAGKDTVYRLHFSDKLQMAVEVQVDHIHFEKFTARKLHGKVQLTNQVLSAPALHLNTMEGGIVLSGSVNASRRDSILVSAEADIKKINITQLFYQMGNFGQDIVQEKNLKGAVTADIRFASTWSSALVCNTNKVYVSADILIDNGELIDFEPTMALSKYVKGADLKNIKFSTLKNKVEIRNRTIHFPMMEVNSSAMNITASGTHTFDNIVDYKIRLLLSQLLGKKVKEQNTEFGMIEDDGLGRTSIFLRMHGPMRNPKFSYDNKSVEDKMVEDIKGEKTNLKKVLNNEFGWFKKDTAVAKKQPDKPKLEEIEIDYEDVIEEN